MNKFFVFLLLFSGMTLVWSDTIYVPEDYEMIQSAINVAADGDKIIVSPGTYEESIDFLGKAITVASWYYTTLDTSYISQTVILGGKYSSVVQFISGEFRNSVLTGFTITGGYIETSGGGILCDNGSSPILSNLKIIGNHADAGGGLYCGVDCSPYLTASLLRNNYSYEGGGGAYAYYCDLIMEDVVFDANYENQHGGGICCISSNLLLNNVSLRNNYTSGNYGYGGGIYYYWNSEIIMNSCELVNNSASRGGGISGEEMVTLNMKNVIIQNNTASTKGGGIYSSEADINLQNVIIKNNTADSFGGGIFSQNSNSNLTNVVISDNTALQDGGGLFLNGYDDPILVNVIIEGNSAENKGGGLYCINASNDPCLINSIMYNDIPQEIFIDDGWGNIPCEVTIAWSDIEGGYEGIEIFDINSGSANWLEGNIAENPIFMDELNDNYRLMPDSPCINSGTEYFEYDGEILVNLESDEYWGTAPDMGAYEYKGDFTVFYGDINNNYAIESFDVSLILQYSVGLDPVPEDPLPWENWRWNRGDVDLDNNIGATDAAYILQYVVGIIDELPIRDGSRNSEATITISHDESYIYFSTENDLVSLYYLILDLEGIKTGTPEVLSGNTLHYRNNDELALVSAESVCGKILRIPYFRNNNASGSISIEIEINGYAEQINYNFTETVPTVTDITSIYPNPFNPETTIAYQLAEAGNVKIEVYNVRGQKNATLLNEQQSEGYHTFKWDAAQNNSGVYFVRLTSGA